MEADGKSSKDSSEGFINLNHCYKFQLTKFFNLNVIIICPNSIDPSGLNSNALDEQDLFIIKQNISSMNQMGNSCLVFKRNYLFCPKISQAAEESRELTIIISSSHPAISAVK